MPPFKIVSDFGPTGDQPQAVDRPVAGLERIVTAEELETWEQGKCGDRIWLSKTTC